MSKRTSLLARLSLLVRNQFADPRIKKVGEDHLGNVYYLREADPQEGLKERRYFEPTDKQDIVPETPVEWEAWLRYRRNNPPTQEELDKNYALTMRTLKRAKELEEKEYLEKGDTIPESQSSLAISNKKVTSKSEERKFPERPGLQFQPGVDPDDKQTGR